LGVLMEKQLTTPDQYPLTLNSVVTACNQKSSRDPVTNLTQGEVLRSLSELENKLYVRKERGSRAEKYSQNFMNHLELGRKQQALLCVMMLRGPQSVSELNSRTQRMCDFVDREDLERTTERLCDRNPPYVMKLSPQPGQRGERYAHLFSGTPKQTSAAPAESERSSNSQEPPTLTHNDGTHPHLSNEPSTTSTGQDSLSAKIERLEARMSALENENADIKRRVDDISN